MSIFLDSLQPGSLLHHSTTCTLAEVTSDIYIVWAVLFLSYLLSTSHGWDGVFFSPGNIFIVRLSIIPYFLGLLVSFCSLTPSPQAQSSWFFYQLPVHLVTSFYVVAINILCADSSNSFVSFRPISWMSFICLQSYLFFDNRCTYGLLIALTPYCLLFFFLPCTFCLLYKLATFMAFVIFMGNPLILIRAIFVAVGFELSYLLDSGKLRICAHLKIIAPSSWISQ